MMPELTLESICKVTGGSPVGPGKLLPSGYSIDTRTLKEGDLFFAIIGPNHDGHRFVGDAIAKGATGLVVSDPEVIPRPPQATVPAIVVPDTLRALQDLAAFARRGISAKVVAITGSSGKTTTKEMTRHVIEAAFRVHASRGNLNNLYGCPLSILEMGDEHQVSVLEMGMSYHGELARLAEIADPDIGVLTNVTGAHLAHFSSLDDVAAAKAELFEGMRDNSIGIFNNDDERCRRIMATFKGYGFTFGIDRPSDLTAADYRMDGLDGASFEVRHAHNGRSHRVHVSTRFTGVHHVYNALAALSAGYMLGIDLESMAARLTNLAPLVMRGQVVRLKESVRILDDSYNSNPSAMRYALQVLREASPAAAGGRKILVFGDMLELGEGELKAHRELGPAISDCGADIVVTVGKLAGAVLPDAGGIETHRFKESAEAARFVAELARPGDLFLVKGSRGVALEKIVTAIKQRFGEE